MFLWRVIHRLEIEDVTMSFLDPTNGPSSSATKAPSSSAVSDHLLSAVGRCPLTCYSDRLVALGTKLSETTACPAPPLFSATQTEVVLAFPSH